jgi:uncharacterized protein YycO
MKNKHKVSPQLADIIMTHNYGIFGWWVRILTKSYWNHCGLYLGDGKILDVLGRGIEIIDYNRHYKYKVIHKFIRVKGLTERQRKAICQYALKYVGRKFNLWLIFGFKGNKGFTCSGLIGQIFKDKGYAFSSDLLTISPADIDRSVKTYDIDNPPNRQKTLKRLVDIIKHDMKKHDFSLAEIIAQLEEI